MFLLEEKNKNKNNLRIMYNKYMFGKSRSIALQPTIINIKLT